MTKRQANTIIAGIVAVILTQILCTVVLVRSLDRTHKEAASAQASAIETVEIRKEAVELPRTELPASVEPQQADGDACAQSVEVERERAEAAEINAHLEAEQAELENLLHKVQNKQGAAATTNHPPYIVNRVEPIRLHSDRVGGKRDSH